MNKHIILGTAFLSTLLLSNIAQAASGDVTQTNPGDNVVVESTNMAQAPNITFRPSTNVIIEGQSSATSFALAAWHDQAISKANGQAYGMASDSNKMFALDIEANAVPGDISTTTAAAAFSGAGWYTM